MTRRLPLSARAERVGILPERVLVLNDAPVRPDRPVVLYWMQAAQRERCNHALEYAVLAANELKKPLVVWFGLCPDYPGATARAYAFMLEGIARTAQALQARGIGFVCHACALPDGLAHMSDEAGLIVTDRGTMPHQHAWRQQAAGDAPCRFVQVETETVVPVEWASQKEEYAARTLRPRIQRQLERFLIPLRRTRVIRKADTLDLDSLDVTDPGALLATLSVDATPPPSAFFTGGTDEARRRLRRFLAQRLERYDEDASDPSLHGTSQLSPYLHFGQIAALDVALAVRKRGGAGAEAFLEQLIVRRELAINFTTCNPDPTRYDNLPAWARKSLAAHARDKRATEYTPEQLERAETHDPYWNAAQTEMVVTGHMHNYMRMYWGKKVLEWSASPAAAFVWLLRMNDRYELDGRGPNGVTGVAWIFGKHDRPWTERPVFGTVRYMNARGLERKFDIQSYVRQVGELPR